MLAAMAVSTQPFAAFVYLDILDLFSALAAGSWVAWLLVSIILTIWIFVACCVSCAVLARRRDNLRPYIEEDVGWCVHRSSLAHLCADIHELEDARGQLQAFVCDRLSLEASTIDDAGNLFMRYHHESSSRSDALLRMSNLQLLFTMKACDEMIENLRGRLAAACHKVTGLWLTDVTEAIDAMLYKLKSP